MVKKKIPKEYALPRWFWYVLAAIILTIVLAIIGSVTYSSYWKSGWPAYKAAVEKCEGRPPIEGRRFIEASYIRPTDDAYRIPGENGYRTYFCTESEAKQNGYTHREQSKSN